MLDSIIDGSAWVIPVLLAIMLHEVSHGWVAERFGDDTARVMGRITLNPLKHIDLFGTIILPAVLIFAGSPMLFGYAKPVPVNFAILQPPRLGMRMVAIAGPAMNVLLALITGILLHLQRFITPEQAPWLFLVLYRSLVLNCGLAVFNMLPILPLDGGRVVYSFLSDTPARWFGKLERRGIWVVLGILLAVQFMGYNLNDIIGVPVFALMKAVMFVTGNGD